MLVKPFWQTNFYQGQSYKDFHTTGQTYNLIISFEKMLSYRKGLLIILRLQSLARLLFIGWISIWCNLCYNAIRCKKVYCTGPWSLWELFSSYFLLRLPYICKQYKYQLLYFKIRSHYEIRTADLLHHNPMLRPLNQNAPHPPLALVEKS